MGVVGAGCSTSGRCCGGTHTPRQPAGLHVPSRSQGGRQHERWQHVGHAALRRPTTPRHVMSSTSTPMACVVGARYCRHVQTGAMCRPAPCASGVCARCSSLTGQRQSHVTASTHPSCPIHSAVLVMRLPAAGPHQGCFLLITAPQRTSEQKILQQTYAIVCSRLTSR